MKRVVATLSLSLLVFAYTISAAPGAAAIGNGVPDGSGHPNVGALIVDLEVEPGTFEKSVICSGSLISASSPDTGGGVFLTAGHCTDFLPSLGITEVWVSFETDVDPVPSSLLQGTYVTHPGFNPSSLFNDLSVVLLDDPVTGIAPADLPTSGLLDQMKAAGSIRDQVFTNVGYGVVPSHKGGPPSFTFDGVRRVSTSPFGGLPASWLRLLMNVDATGEGGSCFGDSGSPKFLGDSNTIVAVTSWGDAVCRAHNMNWRLDIASSRNFLDDFVTLPA